MTKSLYGVGAFEKVKDYLDEAGAKKILLVTGRSSFSLSGAEQRLEPILKDIPAVRFYDFEVNPKIEDVKKGVSCLVEEGCDLIMAIGGGSALDMAKLINYYNQVEVNQIDIGSEISAELLPMIAVPTTSGSGSEATHFAVIYKEGVKYSLANQSLLPQYVVVDPQLTYACSPYLTAVCGLDAFAQASESYWNVNSTEESRQYALEAVQILWKNLGQAVSQNTPEAKDLVVKASNLAGKAINISKTTAPHAISYSFTTHFGIAHGHAVSLTLPFFFGFNYKLTSADCTDNRGEEFVKQRLNDLFEVIGAKGPDEAVTLVRDFISGLNIELSIDKLGIDAEELDGKILNGINPERLKNNPRALLNDQLKLYLLAY